ncbi:unnamed protein product [Linum tenue]|uniref:Uncharacterized protein n=1 Tax=Linum tenue TaxID=586396 RepID=A0AAV0K711_9ROSI|nr:unnamed protein product [Linum tenue]
MWLLGADWYTMSPCHCMFSI